MRVHTDGADVRAIVIGGQHTWLARCVMGLGVKSVQYLVEGHSTFQFEMIFGTLI